MHTMVYLVLSFTGTALRLLEQPVQYLLAQVSFLAMAFGSQRNDEKGEMYDTFYAP